MRVPRTVFLLVWTLVSALAFSSCSSSAGLSVADNFDQALRNENTATSFERLVDGGGGFAALLGEEKYTLLVPVDAAFSLLGMEELMTLMSPTNKSAGTDIVKAHIAIGAFPPEKLTTMSSLSLLNGKSVAVSASPALQIGGATVIKTWKTKQGYVYFINRIL